MADDRKWRLHPITSKTTRDQLIDLLDACPSFAWPAHRLTKAEMVHELRERRRAYWDTTQPKRPLYDAPTRTFDGLSAKEANAFLRSLPPFEAPPR